jgi:glycosyltransferase involved in cell wall biosynthesis
MIRLKEKPLVSIGLPVYNGQKYISDAIDSVLRQTFSDFELIITDNASTDDTKQICLFYAEKDKRVKYFRKETNLGAAPNFNYAFKLSEGKYFKWIAHDDVIAPDFIEKCLKHLETEPDAVLCSSNVGIIDENGFVIDTFNLRLNTNHPEPSKRFRSLILDWHLCFDVFGLIRASALKRTPLMGGYGHGDGVLLARLGLIGHFIKLDDTSLFFRKHPEQSMQQYGEYDKLTGKNDYREYSYWFDLSNKNKNIYPHWRILKEYFLSIQYANNNLMSTSFFICYVHLIRWMIRLRKQLLSDLTNEDLVSQTFRKLGILSSKNIEHGATEK